MIIEFLKQLFSDYTLRNVIIGSSVLGIVSGALGSYAVLKKQSLLGDAISHAALPGIVLAFILTGMKSQIVLLTGAVIAGLLATLFILAVTNNTRIKTDSAMGLILSVFFGFGLVLLTKAQKMPTASQAGLDKYLFGQAAALITKDIITMSILGGLSLFIIMLLWKEFKLLCFDPEFGNSLGFPMKALDILLTAIIVAAIVIGLQTVGVVLMSAMLIAPAAAARQWTDKLHLMVILSSVFGAAGGIIGGAASSLTSRVPTGPAIVISISGIVFFSILFAFNRGLIWNYLKEKRQRNRIQADKVLTDLLILAKHHNNTLHGHSENVLKTMSSSSTNINKSLKILENLGMTKQMDKQWSLTPKGFEYAEKISKQHLSFK